MKSNLELWVYRAVGAVFLIYIILRAKFIPMTVDEVSTCISHVPRKIVDILFYQTDAVPNNHILNTLGIKLLTWFFGFYHFTVRIPAMVGGLLYMMAVLAFSKQYKEVWMRAFVLILLFGNPFVLEFFSLARGYGLAVGIMLLAMWKAVSYFHEKQDRDLLYACLLAVLAVEANFTLLNWFVPFLFLLAIVVYQVSSRSFIRAVWPVVTALIVLACLAYYPITRMRATDQFQFWGSASFFQDTMLPFLFKSTLRHPYLGKNTGENLAWLIIVFSVIAWIVALVRWYRNQWKLDTIVLLSGIYAGTVVFNLMQSFLFKTPFLDARTSIFFYPLFALQLCAIAACIQIRWKAWALCMVLPLSIFTLVNFRNCCNLNTATEWWFDKGTFKVLEFLKATYEAEGKKVPYSLESNWLNYNSLDFHTKHSTPHYEKYALLPEWHPRRTFQGETEFYYTEEREEIDALVATYDIVFRVHQSGLVLLRKKPAPSIAQ